jgi:hypothetical protein
MIRALCIDDTRIPSDIPTSHRIKKDRWYTITFIHNIARTERELVVGVELKEISLLELNIPYECWKADRFGVSLDDLDKLKKLAEDSLEVDDFNIDELFEEQLVTLPEEGSVV